MKLMIGYDGSNSAKAALSLGIEHAKAFNAEMLVLKSLTGGTVTEKVEIQYAKEELEEVRQTLDKEGIPCETELLVRGFTPGEDIVRLAKERDVDEIVIGVKRRSKVGKLLFGSNAQYVIIQAHCPVVVVK